MATKAANQDDSGTLKYKTWVLKVFIHCEGCKKKVKKILQAIDGVYETNIDSKQHKVTVTCSVDEETLIKKLTKSGKYVQPWPEKVEKKDKNPGKSKNNNEKLKDGQQAADNSAQKPNIAASTKHDGADGGKGKPEENNQPPEGNQMGGENEEPDTSAESGGKKKKKKGKKGSSAGPNGDAPPGETSLSALPQPVPDYQVPPKESINQRPTNQPMYPYGPMYYGPPLFGVNYNTSYPSETSSGYAPTMHSDAYESPPPPYDPIDKINEDYDHHDYDDDDYETGCPIV